MKKLLLIFISALFTITVNAQIVHRTPISIRNNLNRDTIIDGNVQYMLVTPVGTSTNMVLLVEVNGISGTVGGAVTLMGSNDGGINYVPVSSLLSNGNIGLDTLKVTNTDFLIHTFIIPILYFDQYYLKFEGTTQTMEYWYTAFEREILAPTYLVSKRE